MQISQVLSGLAWFSVLNIPFVVVYFFRRRRWEKLLAVKNKKIRIQKQTIEDQAWHIANLQRAQESTKSYPLNGLFFTVSCACKDITLSLTNALICLGGEYTSGRPEDVLIVTVEFSVPVSSEGFGEKVDKWHVKVSSHKDGALLGYYLDLCESTYPGLAQMTKRIAQRVADGFHSRVDQGKETLVQPLPIARAVDEVFSQDHPGEMV